MNQQFEVGQIWLDGFGRAVEVLKVVDDVNDDYPILGLSDRLDPEWYAKDGRCLDSDDKASLSVLFAQRGKIEFLNRDKSLTVNGQKCPAPFEPSHGDIFYYMTDRLDIVDAVFNAEKSDHRGLSESGRCFKTPLAANIYRHAVLKWRTNVTEEWQCSPKP